MPSRPSWFTDGRVLISNAPTCGINKDGDQQFLVDPDSGLRSDSVLDDQLSDDVDLVLAGEFESGNLSLHSAETVRAKRILVPGYYDHRAEGDLAESIEESLDGFEPVTLDELTERGHIRVMNGDGSPSLDQRVGGVPYVKVSDLRAGRVNINPSNMVPLALARKFWKSVTSRYEPYDLVSPVRASKNIGEFCVLMPGQENVVFTKEVVVVRATDDAPFDQFYLMWALTLEVVREQWKRIVFMQTNRDDVGDRYLEIAIPYPPSREEADRVSAAFKSYYLQMAELRETMSDDLTASPLSHHFYEIWTGDDPSDET